MIRIGSHRISWRGASFQARKPVVLRQFLCFQIITEVTPTGVDTKAKFPLGTLAKCEGKVFRYYKAGSQEIKKDSICTEKGGDK